MISISNLIFGPRNAKVYPGLTPPITSKSTPDITPAPTPIPDIKTVRWNEIVSCRLIEGKEVYMTHVAEDGKTIAFHVWDEPYKNKSRYEQQQIKLQSCVIKEIVRAAIASKVTVEAVAFPNAIEFGLI